MDTQLSETRSESVTDETSDSDSVIEVVCKGKPRLVSVASRQNGVNLVSSTSVNVENGLVRDNRSFTKSQQETGASGNDALDLVESVDDDLEDLSSEQRVVDSVSLTMMLMIINQ